MPGYTAPATAAGVLGPVPDPAAECGECPGELRSIATISVTFVLLFVARPTGVVCSRRRIHGSGRR